MNIASVLHSVYVLCQQVSGQSHIQTQHLSSGELCEHLFRMYLTIVSPTERVAIPWRTTGKQRFPTMKKET